MSEGLPKPSQDIGEDFYIACSDDEKYSPGGEDRGKLSWTPAPELVLQHYQAIDKQGYIELEWRNPGRRPPTPSAPEVQEQEEEEEAVGAADFDFEEEGAGLMTPQQRRTPGTVGLRGSARKKTTSLDSVLANMKKHKHLDEMETGTPASSKTQQ